MNMCRRILFFVTVLSAYFINCSTQNTAGVISETTNGVRMTGKLIDTDGKPLSGAPVSLRSIESCTNCPDNVERTSISSNGYYVFDSVPTGTFVVYANSLTSHAAALTVTIPNDSGEIHPGDLKVSSTITKTGFIAAPSDAYPVTVSVCGTSLSAVSDLTGNFILPNLPSGSFLLRLSSASLNLQPVVIPVTPSASDTITFTTTPKTIIDNFDDGDGVHMLNMFLGTGKWYERHGSDMTLTPAVLPDDLSAAVTGSGAWRGKSLNLNITTGNSGDLAIIACEIGKGLGNVNEPLRWFDLSSMTAITFMAKGEGTLHVSFLTKKIYSTYSGADHFEKIITLSKEWARYQIYVSELKPPEGSDAENNNETWQGASQYVAEISFFSDNATSIGLDDVCLEGVNSLDLIRSGIKR